MNYDIKKIKKDYLRKIFEISLKEDDYSTLLIKANFSLDDVRDILEELKDEFNIKNLSIFDKDFDKIISFFDKNPTYEEIEKFTPKFQEPIGKVKTLYFMNDITDFSDRIYNPNIRRYYIEVINNNKRLFEKSNSSDMKDVIATVCPNKEWAEFLYGSTDKLDDLWIRMSKIVLNQSLAKKEIKERIEIKKDLNRMHIRNLHFYTDLGTDFKISLNPSSIWICDPSKINRKDYFNYPSYEIFTSPNCDSAEGEIVLSKKILFYGGNIVNKAILYFSEGRLVDSISDNDGFDDIVTPENLKLNRIGEIALVPKSSPLNLEDDFYGMRMLDENTGCHFALGNSIEQCIAIPKKILEENGKNYYHYNTSPLHTDLIFGDDSIVVEAETKSKQKVLLMEKGKWKI